MQRSVFHRRSVPASEQVRAFAEKGVSTARDGYQKLEAAESNNGALEAAYTTASKGAHDYTTRLLDIAKINTESAFGFAQSLIGVKSLPEALNRERACARAVRDALRTVEGPAEFAQKVATETVEPIKPAQPRPSLSA